MAQVSLDDVRGRTATPPVPLDTRRTTTSTSSPPSSSPLATPSPRSDRRNARRLKAKGDPRGDFVVFEDRLQTGKRVVGRERGTCFVANARTHVAVGTMGWVLPVGTLTTAGATGAEPPFTMPVIGGTGRFAGSRGTALVRPTKVTSRLLP